MSFLSEDDLRDLQDPDLTYVALSKDQLVRAQAEIGSCVACNPNAEIPFDWLLRDVADQQDYVDYVIPEAGHCPRCQSEVYEKTLVERTGGIDVEAECLAR